MIENAGFGIALVPQTGTIEDANGIRVDDVRAQREVGIAWLGERRLSSAESAFRAFAANAKPRSASDYAFAATFVRKNSALEAGFGPLPVV